MGRKRNHFLRDFFVEKNDQVECKSCGQNISNYTTNLKRHLEKYHSKHFKDVAKKFRANTDNSNNNNNIMEIKTKFLVEMSKEEVINACVNMVSRESLPLSFFDSNSFRVLTNPLFDGLKIAKVNSENVMDLVKSKAKEVKSKIKDMLKNKIVNLNIDAATRNNRSILRINAQIISRNKIEIFSLAMLELKNGHAAENIKIEIENVLNQYEVNKNQLYSVTTYNGGHLTKAVELLSSQSEMDEDIKIEIEDECPDPDQIQNIINNIRFENVTSFKCAAHTLQLSIQDFLRGYVADIERARHVVKILRAPTFRSRLRDCTKPIPQLDVVAQWSSTYNMLQGLLELKEFCILNLSQSDQLHYNEWSAIENLVSVLGPVKELNLKLQKSQLLLGDFYKYWMELVFSLKNIDTVDSKNLLTQIESRQSVLLENETMYAALFLDPRFRRSLSKTKKEIAKNHLMKIFLRILSLEKSPTKQTGKLIIDESSMQSSSSLLRNGLREMEVSNLSSDSYDDNDDDDDNDDCKINDNTGKAFYEIENYKEKRVDIDEDLIEYWNSKKFALPWLRKLALIVHSVPATQVSVERSCSALRLILGDLQYNLSEENLEAILVVKLNADSF